MMELTDKRAGILRALYRETGLDPADFMDKTDLSFQCIDLALNGRCAALSDAELEGFAKGFDMTAEMLTAYLEVGSFL